MTTRLRFPRHKTDEGPAGRDMYQGGWRCPECGSMELKIASNPELWESIECAACGFVGSENQFVSDLLAYWAAYSEHGDMVQAQRPWLFEARRGEV